MSKYRIIRTPGEKKDSFLFHVEKEKFIFWHRLIIRACLGFPAGNIFYSQREAEAWIESGCLGLYKKEKKVVKVIKK